MALANGLESGSFGQLYLRDVVGREGIRLRGQSETGTWEEAVHMANAVLLVGWR